MAEVPAAVEVPTPDLADNLDCVADLFPEEVEDEIASSSSSNSQGGGNGEEDDDEEEPGRL